MEESDTTSTEYESEHTLPEQPMDLVAPVPTSEECYSVMWVSQADMAAVNARLLRQHFTEALGREVLTYVPTRSYFKLHEEAFARRIFKTANMGG